MTSLPRAGSTVRLGRACREDRMSHPSSPSPTCTKGPQGVSGVPCGAFCAPTVLGLGAGLGLSMKARGKDRRDPKACISLTDSIEKERKKRFQSSK